MDKIYTAEKMKFSINDIFRKCDHIRSFLWICSHLPQQSLIENFIFCEVIGGHKTIECDKETITHKRKGSFNFDRKIYRQTITVL